MEQALNPVHWYLSPDQVWIVVISITFWLTLKGITMDIWGRSIQRTIATSFFCVMSILTLPAVLSIFWVPGQLRYTADLIFPIAVAPGEFVMYMIGLING